MPGLSHQKKQWICAWPLVLLLSGCVNESAWQGTPSDAARYEQKNIEIAHGFLQKGYPARSIERLEAVLRVNNRSAQAHGMLGVVYQSQGEYALAAKNFRRALALDPALSAVRNNYGVMLYETGDYATAYSQFEKVTADIYYPGRGRAFENLGMAALRLQDKDAARRFFQRALRLDKNQAQSALELAWIAYEDGQPLEAERLFRIYENLAGTQASARGLLLGIELARTLAGDDDAVRRYADQLARYYPGSPEYTGYKISVQDTPHD